MRNYQEAREQLTAEYPMISVMCLYADTDAMQILIRVNQSQLRTVVPINATPEEYYKTIKECIGEII